MVTVKCVYYKESGKYYSTGEGTFSPDLFKECRPAYRDPTRRVDCIYPSDYGKRLRELGRLPGLHSGAWQGPFTCEIVGSYTELILPIKE